MNKMLFKTFGPTTLHNAFDCITIYSLQEYYDICSTQGNFDFDGNKVELDENLLDAIKVVLSHYMSLPDYEKWLEKADGKN